MLTERDLLVQFCSNAELNPRIVSQILERGISSVLSSNIPKVMPPNSLRSMRHLKSLNAITYLDDHFPQALFDLEDEMPLVLWSDKSIFFKPYETFVTITGTNTLSLTDVRLISRLIQQLDNRATSVLDASIGTSELALKQLVNLEKPSVVIAAAGLISYQVPLNYIQRMKFAEIGILLSENPPHLSLNRTRMLRRNRILAALSSQIIAIRPRGKSGASSILHWAELLGRDIDLI